MDNSEDQFQTLLANLSVRVNKSLKISYQMETIGLLLYENDKVEVYLSFIEDSVSDALTALQNELIPIVREKRPLASCMAYPNYQDQQIIALLENNEHYASEVKFPIKYKPHLHLDLENIDIDDGTIYLFGE